MAVSRLCEMKDENILVVRRSLIEEIGMFQGLNFDVQTYLPKLLAPEHNFFVARPLAENDPSLKQIIPYVLLVSRGRILRYMRGRKGGETRLHAKFSIGIGGHMNDGDAAGGHFDLAAYQRAVERETNEELRITTPCTDRIVALLNDDSNPVGQVHLGVVHVFECESDSVSAAAIGEITQLGFFTPEELRAEFVQLETWSQFCVENLDRLLAR